VGVEEGEKEEKKHMYMHQLVLLASCPVILLAGLGGFNFSFLKLYP
jgi:hypothetical protein